MIDIDGTIDAMSADEARAALKRVLTATVTPAFGALSKRELDLMIFTEMTRLGMIKRRASIYNLVTSLRINRSKAQQLIFDREVRAHSAADLEEALRTALAEAKFLKDGTMFVIEQEDPLLNAHLKERLKKLGHVSDTSFNANLIRMTLDAARDLVVDVIPEAEREDVRKALVKAGAPDDTLKGAVGRTLGKIGEKVGTAATDTVVDAAKEQVKSLVTASIPSILASIPALFS